jgi:nucleoid DNA-binding protein
MTKSGLIEAVAGRTPHISKKDTEIVVNTIFDSMARALKQGERIEIRGFGSFQVCRSRQSGRPSSRWARSSRRWWTASRWLRSPIIPKTTTRPETEAFGSARSVCG